MVLFVNKSVSQTWNCLFCSRFSFFKTGMKPGKRLVANVIAKFFWEVKCFELSICWLANESSGASFAAKALKFS